nr:ABC transporter ATP-binding protein [Sedimentibacter sp.]
MNIKLENVSKKFNGVLAVDNLNIEILDGELICLLGPSGCGKSTTISMIAGLEKVSNGNIYFDGVNVNDVQAENRDIGMVFQNYALYPHMTVLENIMFPLKMRKYKKSLIKEKALQFAELMQITELKNRKPNQLSGGQQQRVAIARALVKEPKILLLDEPLSNLDARLRIELRDEIRNLQQKLKITTIFVTHDQEEAMSISDRILLMNKGVSQQYSSTMEMYMKPNNKFVAGFLGNPPMNFLSGYYEEKTKQLYLQEGNKQIPLPTDKLNKRKGICFGNVIIGIRPEDFCIVKDTGDLVGEIRGIQTLGKEVYLKIDICGTYVTACVSWDKDYCMNEKVLLGIKKIHIFNK